MLRKAFLFSLFSLVLFSQDTRETITVVSQGEYTGQDVTQREGFENAKENAIINAIETEAGINISRSIQKFDSQSEQGIDSEQLNFISSYIQAYSNATVKNVKMLKKDVNQLKIDNHLIPQYVVEVEIQLVIDKEGIDPKFYLETSLNKPAFIEGEELVLSLKASMDCYITVFNFIGRDQVYVLFPNNYMKENFILKNTFSSIPSETDQNKGLSFKMELPDGKAMNNESIVIVATKKDVPFVSFEHMQSFELQSIMINDFQKWLSRIPLNERTLNTELYSVYKENKK